MVHSNPRLEESTYNATSVSALALTGTRIAEWLAFPAALSDRLQALFAPNCLQ